LEKNAPVKRSHHFPIYLSFIIVLLFTFKFDDFAGTQPFGSRPAAAPAQPQEDYKTLPDTAGTYVLKPPFLESYFPTRDAAPTNNADFAHTDSLHSFFEETASLEDQELRGVFVEDVLTLPVIQQPKDDYLFVSDQLGVVTQFQGSAKNGVVGLLAHNYLSGDLFFQLAVDQDVNLVFGDGRVSRYLITDIQSFEKLEGDAHTSNYINLDTGEELTTRKLFSLMYTGEDKVTFQTCIKKGSDWSWGRIFIVATPLIVE
jgi:hypothetical protein